MRTLFICPVFPTLPLAGTGQRIYHLLSALTRVSEVTVLSQVPAGDSSPDTEPFRHLFSDVHFFGRDTIARYRHLRLPPLRRWIEGKIRYCHPRDPVLLQWEESQEGRALAESLCERGFDLVWAERLGSMRLLPKRVSGRVIVDLDDLEHRKLARQMRVQRSLRALPLELLELWRLARLERSLPLLPYEFAVCSSVDRAVLGDSPRVHVIPNGTDLPGPESAYAPPPPAPLFLFIGQMSYQPNVDAVCYFRERVLPLIREQLPTARLMVVGREPHERVQGLHDELTTTVVGPVPSVEPYLRQSTALVTPIRFGGGTRIKILEALAHQRPVVTSKLGVEGLELEDGTHLLVADSPVAFAAACVRLHKDPALHRRLSEAGHARILAQYDWAKIEEKVTALARAPQPAVAIP